MNSELKQKVIEANIAYRKGMPIMSDIEYDNLLEDFQKTVPLKEYDEFRNTLNEGCVVVSDRKKIKHDFVAGSLDKLKYEEPDTIKKFISKHVKSQLHVSAKIDGLSGIAKYIDGKLVSLGTRGDGYIGEDHTEKAKYIKYLPLEISIKDPVSIRGELVILKNDLTNIEGTAARNAVSGLIGRKEWNSKDISNVSFIAYTILGEKYTKKEQFDILGSLGFNVAWNTVISGSNTQDIAEVLFSYATKDFEYETDGLVLSDVSYKNEDAYRPDAQMAFKTNQQAFETKLIDVEFSTVSKDGFLTPVGILEPVDCEGVIVSRCTLHNLDFITEKGIKLGSMVKILRSGDVIPKLISVVNSDENCVDIQYPTTCPCCGNPLVRDGVNLRCTNRQCKDQIIQRIVLFIKKLGCKHASNATLENFGITSFESLLSFVPNNKYKLQVTLAKELNEHVFTKSKKELISALNFTGLSETMIGKIIDFYGIENIESGVYTGLPSGIGEVTLQKFKDDIVENLEIVNKIIADTRYNSPRVILDEPRGKSNGMSICFTGKLNTMGRSEAEKKAIAFGFDVKGVSKNLTYLVTNDPNTNSGKGKKARDLGIKIISENDFLKLISNTSNDLDFL